jgi:hypothetical protein
MLFKKSKFVSDSISNFKGDVLVQVAGNTLIIYKEIFISKRPCTKTRKIPTLLMILTLIPASIQKELEQ